MRNRKTCIICGGFFFAPPSSKKITCSKECSSERKRQTHPITNPQNHSPKPSREEIQKMAVRAAIKSPLAGRFETNASAKRWILISPGGETFVVRNLLKWARENTYRFGKEPGEKSAEQISKGFSAIAQTMRGERGTPGKQRGAMTYFGWTLQGPPAEIK